MISHQFSQTHGIVLLLQFANAQDYRKIRTDGCADRTYDLRCKTGAVLDRRATLAIVSLVRPATEKLIDKTAMCAVDFDRIKPRRFASAAAFANAAIVSSMASSAISIRRG